MAVWKDSVTRKEGFYWRVDTVFGSPNHTLMEVKKVCGIWMSRQIDSVNWYELSSGDGYKYHGPLQAPEYDFDMDMWDT